MNKEIENALLLLLANQAIIMQALRFTVSDPDVKSKLNEATDNINKIVNDALQKGNDK